MRLDAGFTLVELVLVIVLVGVIACRCRRAHLLSQTVFLH